MQIVSVTLTFRYLHQRVKEHWHFVIGEHFKDEQNLRRVNLYENFKIVFLNAEESLSEIFEMRMIRKKRPTLNTQADSIRAKLFSFVSIFLKCLSKSILIWRIYRVA